MGGATYWARKHLESCPLDDYLAVRTEQLLENVSLRMMDAVGRRKLDDLSLCPQLETGLHSHKVRVFL